MSAETKFSFRAWSNILPTKPPDATIEGILLRGRFGVIFAQPDNGKTFAAIGAALSVGTGQLFGDRAVRKGHSIYIAAEAAYDVEVRAPAWRILHPDAGEPLGGCYGQVVNFYRDDEVRPFIADLKKRLNGEHLELLVIDTLAASMVGGNQDWSKDMTMFINNVKMVMNETGCAVLVVHHAGWNETSREKGSIDLRGAADVVIETTLGEEQPDGSRIITLTCRKMKSMRKFQPFSMALAPVTIDTPEGSFESLALGASVAAPATEAGAGKKTDKEAREQELDELMWITALSLSRPPERLIQYSAWFELTKANRGGKLGTETFSKAVKRLVDSGQMRKVGELYQVVLADTAEAAGPGTSASTSTSTSTSASGPYRGPEVPEVRSKASGSTSGSSEVTSTVNGNSNDSVVPDAAYDAVQQLTRKKPG